MPEHMWTMLAVTMLPSLLFLDHLITKAYPLFFTVLSSEIQKLRLSHEYLAVDLQGYENNLFTVDVSRVEIMTRDYSAKIQFYY